MDPARGACIGCGRTLDEIARWGSMTDGERENVMQELELRLAQHSSSRQAETTS